MANWILIFRDRINTKANPLELGKSFGKGECIGVRRLGSQKNSWHPGIKGKNIEYYRYVRVMNKEKADFAKFEEQLMDQSIKNEDGKADAFKSKCRYKVLDALVDSFSSDWANPTQKTLSELVLYDKT